MARFCSTCGSELPEGSKFCTSCGAFAAAEEPVAAEPVAQEAPETRGEPEPTVESIVEEVRMEAAAKKLQWQPEDAEPEPEAEPKPEPKPEPVTPVVVTPTASVPQPPVRQPAQPPVVRPPVYNSPNYSVPPQPPEEQPPEDPDRPPLKSKWSIMSSWGTVGALALMGIPGIGFIITIVWACGGCRKYVKRNLARAFLLLLAIALIVLLVGGAIAYLLWLRPILPDILGKITAVFETIFEGYTIHWN